MASQTQGIQQLLAAEKRAAEKVSEARKRKWKKAWFYCVFGFLFFVSPPSVLYVVVTTV